MDDDAVIAKEQFWSTLKSAPKARGEVLAGPERRRWSVEEKLRILGQSVAPGPSVSLVCRMHGISSGQLCTWRKQFLTGELTGFAPVKVLADAPVEHLPPPARPTASPLPLTPTAPPAPPTIPCHRPPAPT